MYCGIHDATLRQFNAQRTPCKSERRFVLHVHHLSTMSANPEVIFHLFVDPNEVENDVVANITTL